MRRYKVTEAWTEVNIIEWLSIPTMTTMIAAVQTATSKTFALRVHMTISAVLMMATMTMTVTAAILVILWG
jgi:hypothetical protein